MIFHYERVPRWIAVVAIAGVPTAWVAAGPLAAAGFCIGTLGSWWNYAYLVKAVTALTRAAADQSVPSSTALVAGLLLRFLILGIGSIVILKYSKISLIALAVGLLAASIAICLELLYDLLWKSTKFG